MGCLGHSASPSVGKNGSGCCWLHEGCEQGAEPSLPIYLVNRRPYLSQADAQAHASATSSAQAPDCERSGNNLPGVQARLLARGHLLTGSPGPAAGRGSRVRPHMRITAEKCTPSFGRWRIQVGGTAREPVLVAGSCPCEHQRRSDDRRVSRHASAESDIRSSWPRHWIDRLLLSTY